MVVRWKRSWRLKASVTEALWVAIAYATAIQHVLQHATVVPAQGHPHCFEGAAEDGFTFERCCDTRLGAEGDVDCWDSVMNFGYCCRPPKPLPLRDPSCWQGLLRHMHEACCRGTQRIHGPRGMLECWARAASQGEPGLSARRCCDGFSAGATGQWCLAEGFASTCSWAGVVFRLPDLVDDGFVWSNLSIQSRPTQARSSEPTFWSVPQPHPKRRPLSAHFLTLGVGRFAVAARRLHREALDLQLFTEVHSYTSFGFLQHESKTWSNHLAAWRDHKAPIAGYGWWKPVLCRRHLEAAELPFGAGLLIFSDAGSHLSLQSRETWQQLLMVMRRFDVLAVLEPDFAERRFTKRRVLARFEDTLRFSGTDVHHEGQFLTGLFALRKTSASLRLLQVWEHLVRDIHMVDESLDEEAPGFVAHRHEQSVWSLLLKSAILGRAVGLASGSSSVNLSARVLTVLSGYEASRLIEFTRWQS